MYVYFLQYKYCYYIDIKDKISVIYSLLYKYIEKIIIFIVLTVKKYLKQDIWFILLIKNHYL